MVDSFVAPSASDWFLRPDTKRKRKIYLLGDAQAAPARPAADYGRMHVSLFRRALVLGLGLGGFLDGIVLHQILGWHHLVCTTATCRPETVAELMRQNTQDGFFHLATWLLTVTGIFLILQRPLPTTARTQQVVVGGAVAGWGVFNFVEGLIDHQLLNLHHVRPESPHWLVYDLLFLASGPLLFLVGRRIARLRVSTENT